MSDKLSRAAQSNALTVYAVLVPLLQKLVAKGVLNDTDLLDVFTEAASVMAQNTSEENSPNAEALASILELAEHFGIRRPG